MFRTDKDGKVDLDRDKPISGDELYTNEHEEITFPLELSLFRKPGHRKAINLTLPFMYTGWNVKRAIRFLRSGTLLLLRKSLCVEISG